MKKATRRLTYFEMEEIILSHQLGYSSKFNLKVVVTLSVCHRGSVTGAVFKSRIRQPFIYKT